MSSTQSQHILKFPRWFFWAAHSKNEKKTARNKQIVFFEESRKTVKLKLFLEKAQKGHRGKFLDIDYKI